MREDWTKNMKQKMEGHRKSPPADLWEGISRQMGLAREPVRKPFVIRRWYYWAAAAVALLLAGFFAFYHQDSTTLPLQAGKPSQPSQTVASSGRSVLSEIVADEKSSPSEPSSKKGPKPMVTQALALVRQEEGNVTSQGQASEPSVPAETKESRGEQPIAVSGDANVAPKHSAGSGKWTVGLNASGGLLAANNSVRTDRLYAQASVSNALNEKSDYHPYTNTDFVSKHHLPVRFGVSVQYQLNPHLALLGGIGYTRLSSEFSIPLYPNISYDQTLHYLGVPVGLAWQLWSTKHFHFYLSGSVMVEKCVKVDLDEGYTGKTDKKPWQWSVNAAAGAEYSVSRLLGLYLEPSLGYYFDDGTSLEHYYKEHSLAPTIEFGLRLHLPQ